MVHVSMGDEHGFGISRVQAEFADSLQHQVAVGGVTAVDQDEAGVVRWGRCTTDDEPVGCGSFDEVDAGRGFGDVHSGSLDCLFRCLAAHNAEGAAL